VAPPAGERTPVVEIGYGTDYALPIHERWKGRNKRARDKPGGSRQGERRWLLNAMNKYRPVWVAMIGKLWKINQRTGLGVDAVAAQAPRKPTDKGEAWQKEQRR
jgi:hypothetical protein